MTAGWYRRVFERLGEVGFRGSIMDELRDVVIALEAEAVKATVGARS